MITKGAIEEMLSVCSYAEYKGKVEPSPRRSGMKSSSRYGVIMTLVCGFGCSAKDKSGTGGGVLGRG